MNREQPSASEVEHRVISRLRRFTETLEAVIPIEAVEVRRVETPDGPMHLRRHVVLNVEDGQ